MSDFDVIAWAKRAAEAARMCHHWMQVEFSDSDFDRDGKLSEADAAAFTVAYDADKAIAAIAALHSQANECEGCPTAEVREMKAGADSGFYVCVQVGSRYLTPNRYREKWMADFDAAEWNALFTGSERPHICAFDPTIAAAPTGGSEP